MKNNQLISIYIPTRNRVESLRKAINSVLAQTYTNWELIVVNDASTDNTKEFLDNLTVQNPKIRAIHHTESQGACVSRNDAIFSAKGIFVTGLDDDDEFESDRLSDFLNAWYSKPDDIVLLYSNNKFKNNKTITISNRGKIATKLDLINRNRIGNQIFTTLENIRKIGGFDSNLSMWQDLDCWYRLLNYGNGLLVDNASYVMDVSDRDDRITTSNSKKLESTYKYFCNKHKLKLMERWLLLGHFAQYNQYHNFFIRRIKLKIAGKYYKKS
ncbi:glycosyltransferase involved in cell wall biosynthesis [Epilithonimonas hungarica]|uniref:glycosyltransferase n=1 Tax=Epilithonimonas hungarica TaxID=454006 RepID=UPI002789A6AF|nr:glycosyltransferase [Epilithonimonas hungarica]MDP9956829.1 glycosyltransferase involved in cell wall biosynthesis [Epilithonimonas hungarica]